MFGNLLSLYLQHLRDLKHNNLQCKFVIIVCAVVVAVVDMYMGSFRILDFLSHRNVLFC